MMGERGVGVVVVLVAAMIAGCQSYSPRPLDREASLAAFAARTPESPEVGTYAQRLAEREANAGAKSFDPSDGLSVWEAEAVALVFNGELRKARLRAGVSAVAKEKAGLWEDPVLGVDLTRILESAEHPWKAFSTIGFTVPISGRLEIEKQRAGAEHAAELARVWAAEWETRMAVRRAWAEWSAAGERAATMRESAERLEALVGLVDRIERAGEMSRVEARLFRIEQAGVRVEADRMEAETAALELGIKKLMGLAPPTGVKLVPGVGGAMVEGEVGELRARAVERGPGMAVARAEYEVAEKSLALEVRKQFPDLMIGPGYGREDGQDQFLLGLSAPLPVLNGNQRGIAVASATRELRRGEWETAQEEVIAELEAALARHAAAAAERRAVEERLVPLVDEQYAENRRIAELGEVNALVLLESMKAQREAKLKLVSARASEAIAAVRVEEIAGPVAGEAANEEGGRR